MKSLIGIILFVCCFSSFCLASPATNAISVGGTVSGKPSLGLSAGDEALRETAFVEYETAVTRKLSLIGALGATAYTLDKYPTETEEHEFRGKGVGLDAGFRFYPWGVLKKLHLGFSAGIWRILWRETDRFYYDYFNYVEQPGPTGSSWAYSYGIEAGYQFSLGKNIFIDPFLRAGGFLVHAENSFFDLGFGLRACLPW